MFQMIPNNIHTEAIYQVYFVLYSGDRNVIHVPPNKCLYFIILFNAALNELKHVVEALCFCPTRCSWPENASLLPVRGYCQHGI